MINFNFENSFDKPEIKISYGHSYMSFEAIDYNENFDLYTYEDTVEYRNVWDNVNLIYKKENLLIKEEIEIKSKKSNHVFVFKISSNLLYKNINNHHVFIDSNTNKPYYKLDDFIVFDKNNKEIECKIKCNFNKKNNLLTIKVNKLKQENYPIIVDPSIIIIPYSYSPSKISKNQTVDLDIIHRRDNSGSDYYKEQFGPDFSGDIVSFSRKVDLRLNIQNKIKSIVKNGSFAGTKYWTGFTSKNEIGKWKNYNAKSAKADKTTANLIGKISPVPIKGHTYQVSYKISEYSSGGLTVNLGGTNGPRRHADGEYTDIIIASNKNQIKFIPDNNATFILDNVQVYDSDNISDLDIKSSESKFDITKIQVDVAGTKYVIVNPLKDQLEEEGSFSNEQSLNVPYSLASDKRIIYEGETATISFSTGLASMSGLTLIWSVYVVDNYIKKLIFSHTDIANRSSDKIYGQCSFFSSAQTSIEYKSPDIISVPYYLLANLDVYNNNILKNGNFDNNLNWTIPSSYWTISTSDHKISCTQSTGESIIKGILSEELTIGNTYRVIYKIENANISSGFIKVRVGGNGGSERIGNSAGYFIDEIVARSEDDFIEFIANGNLSADIKEISITDITNITFSKPICSLSEFIQAYSMPEVISSPAIFFSLDPESLLIDNSNKTNIFEVKVNIPRRSAAYISNGEFRWSLKKFESGTISTLISNSEYNNSTAYGRISVKDNTKTLNYSAPNDLTVFNASYFIESSVTYLDSFSNTNKTISATCVLRVAEQFQITPNYLRPTICKQVNINYRIHSFKVVPTDIRNQLTSIIPNDENFDFYWTIYVDETGNNQAIYQTWKVIRPGGTTAEIQDLHSTQSYPRLTHFYPYGEVASHYHIDQSLETIGYTLGNKSDIVDYLSSGLKLPTRLYLTYNYRSAGGVGETPYKQLLSIIQPSMAVPEDCSDETFTITLDKHLILSSSTNPNSLYVNFSSDITNLYASKPDDFALIWSVSKFTDSITTETIDPELILTLQSNIKSVIVKPIPTSILSNSNQYLLITATLTYIPNNNTASDSCFVLKNTDNFSVDNSAIVTVKGGKRLSISLGGGVEYGLTYNHSDYSTANVAARKIKLEIISPETGQVLVDVNDILYPTNPSESENKKSRYGYSFLTYQFPQFNTLSNRLVAESSYTLTKGITYYAPAIKPDFSYVIMRTGLYNPTTMTYDYYHTLISFVDQIYPNIYPDIFRPSMNGVEEKQQVGGDRDNYIKKIYAEPDRAYEFKITNDIYDDGNLNTTISLTGYELFLYRKENNTIKIINYYNSEYASEGILQECWGIKNTPLRSYLNSSGNQCFNVQLPPKDKPFLNDPNNYYNSIYSTSTSKLENNLFFKIIGKRNDIYETIIEIDLPIITIPIEENVDVPATDQAYIYKNPKHGFTNNPKISLFMVDPFPANIPDLSRHYLSNTDYYIYVISTNSDLITNNASRYKNLFMDGTPNDAFTDSNSFINNKTFYTVELDAAFSETVASNTLVYREKFAFGHNSRVGNISLIGGMNFDGLISDFIVEFESKFQSTYSNSNNSKLKDRLIRLITQKYSIFKNRIGSNSLDTINIGLQLNVYKWTSPTFTTDIIPLKMSVISGKSDYLSGDSRSIQCYFSSNVLELKEQDPKPEEIDLINNKSIYINNMNNDIYVGLIGNGMKYATSNKFKEYYAPDTETLSLLGQTYDPTLEDNMFDRFIFPEYRFNGDGFINYDFTNKSGTGGTIRPEGISFPNSVSKFLLYFDHINIKYILFFGTVDGLWCFDDIDIYSNFRTLRQHGLCKKIFTPGLKNSYFNNEITDIKMIFPSLDVCFSTNDSVFILKAETISLHQLNFNISESNLWQNQILVKASAYPNVGSSDSVQLGGGQDILFISSLCRVAKPDNQPIEGDHSGRIIVKNQDKSSKQGVIITLVTVDYTSGMNHYGKLIWHVELIYSMDDNRTVLDLSNDISAASRYNKEVNLQGSIPDIKPKTNKTNIFSTGYKHFESIDSPIFLGGNYLNKSGSNSRALISSMHRQQTWITEDTSNNSSSISNDFSISGIDEFGKSYSDINNDYSDKVFMSPLLGYIPLHTRMVDSAAPVDRTTCIGEIKPRLNSADFENHLDINARMYTTVSISNPTYSTNPGVITFVPYSMNSGQLTTINSVDNGDIFWRLYYNLLIKQSSSTIFDATNDALSYGGFIYLECPASNYTLIQVPKTVEEWPNAHPIQIDKSLWIYNNDDPQMSMSTLINYINTNIDEDNRDVYIKQYGQIVSLKLKKIGNNLSYLNLVTGSFLKNLKQTLSDASDGDLVFVGWEADNLSATDIQNYLDESSRYFVLICHEPKVQIYNSGTSTSTAAEKRVYWNGKYTGYLNSLINIATEVWIYESVRLNNTETDSRKSYIGGLTYYNNTTSSFSAFAESTSENNPNNTIDYIPNTNTVGEVTTDTEGTVLYAENSIKKFLNPFFSDNPYASLNSIFHIGHGIIDDADKSSFYGNDSGSGDPFACVTGEIIEDNSTSGSNIDRFLYKQLLDYMKIVQYVSFEKYNNKPVNNSYSSMFIDIHGLWSHDFNIDPYYTTNYINSQAGSRRQKLLSYTNLEIDGRTYFRNPYHISGFFPNWAYDGFWQIWEGGNAVNTANLNKSFPVITKSPLPTIFAGDTRIREEERDYPYNLANITTSYFDNKKYFITDFIYTHNGQRILYTVSTNDGSDIDYSKYKIHIYYGGSLNICGDDYTPVVNYNLKDRFPYDYENIGYIRGLCEMGTIDCFNYSDDFLSNIDLNMPVTYAISGTINLSQLNPSGDDHPNDVRLSIKVNGTEIETITPIVLNPTSAPNVGNWDKTNCEYDIEYTITPILSGYSFLNSNNQATVSFNQTNYSDKNFNFVGTYTGSIDPPDDPNTFTMNGRIGITNAAYTQGHATPRGISLEIFSPEDSASSTPTRIIQNLPVQTSGVNNNYAVWSQDGVSMTTISNWYGIAHLQGHANREFRFNEIYNSTTGIATFYLNPDTTDPVEDTYHRSGTVTLEGTRYYQGTSLTFEDLETPTMSTPSVSGGVFGKNAFFMNNYIYIIDLTSAQYNSLKNFSNHKYITVCLTYQDWIRKRGDKFEISHYSYFNNNTLLVLNGPNFSRINRVFNEKFFCWIITRT